MRPPSDVSIRDYVALSALLTALLVIVVPLFAILTPIPTLVAVVLVGLLYAGVLLATDHVFEGISSAVFVLAVFNANVPVANPARVYFGLRLIDVALIPTLAVLIYWELPNWRPQEITVKTIAGASFGVFVLWSFLSVLFGNGVSQFVALLFALQQLRYFAVFITAILLVKRTNLRCCLYPLLLSFGGNLLFALVEIFQGHSFGLTRLGENTVPFRGQFMIGPFVFQHGFYAGGFTGSSRTLAALALCLIAPSIVLAVYSGSKWRIAVTAGVVIASLLVIRVSDTDAGIGAFLLMMAILLIFWIYKDHPWSKYVSGRVGLAIGIGFVVYAYLAIAGWITSGPRITVNEAIASKYPALAARANMFARILSPIPFFSLGSLSIRLNQYVAAIAVAVTYPLFGLGGGNFFLMAESYGVPMQIVVHNIYLSILASTGFPGLFAYLTSTLIILWICISRATDISNDNQLLWGAIAAGLIGFYAFSFWGTVFNHPVANIVLWSLNGLVLGANIGTSG